MVRRMRLSDIQYDLPQHLIAQEPLSDRAASRMLVLGRETSEIQHRHFRNIVELLDPGDLLVMNNTRVSAVRLFGERRGGGRTEALLLQETESGVFLALTKPAKRLRIGTEIQFEGGLSAEVLGEEEGGKRLLRFLDASDWRTLLGQVGRVPLPPYIHQALNEPDRYQTVYAEKPGSSAAPTAGLHFTNEILAALRAKGVETAEVTLDVGLDTFRPIQTENYLDHPMHGERCIMPEATAEAINRAEQRIIAVGTTSARTIESFSAGPRMVKPGEMTTRIFLHPGNPPKVIDSLLTNFHMPGTTMLAMLAGLAGAESIQQAYREAVSHQYRFLSFGDAMLILSG
ncbi:MAG: tRNA preQ1(34) S-adenosylmethionine ribosyltransferase-isomerase QueA [Fimbriimonadaceae bacterium]|nr:tRNA preQ1(34) S-adenosylmethionine ribosyltransferase-isomerase QueA [Fimbriimonadaceae bacterium]